MPYSNTATAQQQKQRFVCRPGGRVKEKVMTLCVMTLCEVALMLRRDVKRFLFDL